ncbi:hypothetical protein SUGI_0036280 [Cryptomeria japonica]|nr:hypothetical protein SUGI_0036280 [Cryptomeria japonica]
MCNFIDKSTFELFICVDGFRSDKLHKSTAFKKTLRTRESFSISAFEGRMGGIFCCKVEENEASLEEQLEFTVRRIHYYRKDHVYENWGLHAWGDINVQTLWEKPLTVTGSDDFGVYWDIRVKPGGVLNFIIHKGETKDFSGSILAEDTDIWVISECSSVFKVKPDLTSVLKGNLSMSRAYWVSELLLAWNLDVENVQFQLFASKSAKLDITSGGIKGEDLVVPLERESGSLPGEIIGKFPHIAHYKAFKLPAGVNVKELVKSQLAIACIDAYGTLMDTTSIQLQGVLDDLFSYDGPLGATFTEDAVMVHLWAPTAQCVRVFVYSSPSGGSPLETIHLKEEGGVWSTCGPRSWEGKYYLCEVTVFHPGSQRVEICMVNDPYSRGLSANGERSLFVNLQDPLLKPEGWESLADEKPQLESFADIVIYELHIRDFSVNDESVDPNLRGTYLGFTSHDSAGMCHLKKLSESGLTHLHLLPSFHFATVDDNKENWKFIDEDTLASLPPDSEEQQAQIVSIQNEDGFNWGYDPVLWGVPKGSYATNPNGSCRTLEFRKMVQALNRIGLRVVLDTVYNHLHASGPNDKGSVLDKVVPGYYLRRNVDGFIENSACANNTASEHYMVNRLIIDDLLLWAMEYKVDGFRFDLMGHLMKSTMVSARNTLDRLLKHENGVDGSKIYIYGEGWDFGEVAHNGRGINASQSNLAGTGIGSFNDRIRDSVIGGSPFGPHLQQGFVTGLYLQPNEHDHGRKDAVAKYLASQADWISVGLAGNLRDFVTINYEGIEVKGSEVKKDDGVPVGYALSPIETINYVSAHDNETLFDMVMWKTAKEVQLEERCRINHLATSIVALSQGIPFFHAGEDMLRSKSLDRDSYNSSDWFNRLDFSYESNNWGVGLPPKEKNGYNWPVMKTFLANPSFRPEKHHILSAVEHFQNMLKIRRSSPLFRLGTANSIQARVRFHNTGPSWVPGSIIMSIEDGNKGMPGLAQLDPLYRRIVVIFNARPSNLVVPISALKALSLTLHPVQEASSDARVKTSLYGTITGTFNIPPRTTSVFVEAR